MQGRVIAASWKQKDGSSWAGIGKHHLLGLMATKASNRSAVHGTRLPVNDTFSKDEEELKEEISKGKLKKEDKRKVIEKNVDSQINPADEAYSTVK